MPAFLVTILVNLLVAAVFAVISGALQKKADTDPPEPSTDLFKPTAKEGTEIKRLFGAGPVELLVVGVFDHETIPIQK